MFNSDDPVVQILIEAAARGRELRALREREPALTAEDQTDDESQFAAAMRQANQQAADDQPAETPGADEEDKDFIAA
jgi:hypothetical protein